MLKLIYLVMIGQGLFACGCEDPEIYINRAEINPAFIEAYNDYHADLVKHGFSTGPNHLKIQFTNGFKELGKIGECEIDKDLNSEVWASIKIDKTFYAKNGPHTDKALLYHELTHCTFYIGHEGEMGNIMFWELDDNDSYWEKNWNREIEVLFNYIKEEEKD